MNDLLTFQIPPGVSVERDATLTTRDAQALAYEFAAQIIDRAIETGIRFPVSVNAENRQMIEESLIEIVMDLRKKYSQTRYEGGDLLVPASTPTDSAP